LKQFRTLHRFFGGINLEDISAPRCFRIEERLKEILNIPVMHDDQHGTAVVVLAALKNALKIVHKDIRNCRIVISGLGAAGIACFRMLLAAGARHMVGCNSKGAVLVGDYKHLHNVRRSLYSVVKAQKTPYMTLVEALKGADVFIGLSVGDIVKPKDLKRMKKNNIVFAMANPDPEVEPHQGMKYCRIFATGRSDFPNQINNALSFPGIFRGALDVRAKKINEDMKLAASHALASLISPKELCEEYIIPGIFDKRVVKAVANAVSECAHKKGLATKRTKAKK